MFAIRIQAFGPLRLWLNGENVPDRAWPTQKSRQLFEILLINHGRVVTADRLMDYLWPELGVKKARNNLWVSVSQVRRVLEPDLVSRTPSQFIHKQGDGYLFQPKQACRLDIEQFQLVLRQAHAASDPNETAAHLQQAVDLYQGDLFTDDPYGEWTIQPRRQLRENFLDVITELAEAHAQQGDFRRAANICRYGLSFDESRESNYRALMLYLYCAGERSEALHVYEEVHQKLLEEIGVEPADETNDLWQQIQCRQVVGVDIEARYPPHDDSQTAIFLLSQMPLVGRAGEIKQLIGLIGQLRNDRGTVGLIAGESGIGKSRLLQEAAEYARQEDITVFTLSCYQVEQNLLYEPLIEVLRQVHQAWPELVHQLALVWRQELAFLIPDIIETSRPVPSLYDEATADQQGRLFQAVRQYLSLAATSGGFVIVFEDIHWADDGTVQFLHYLGSRIGDQRILLLLSYRQEEVAVDRQLADFIHHIQRQPVTTSIALNRLTKQDLAVLLSSQLQIPEGWSDWLYDETAGNPYFIVSILQSLVERHLVPADTAESTQPPQEMTLPHSIKESVRQRLRQLEAKEKVVLEWIAVYGRPLEFLTLQALTAHKQSDLLEIVEHLLRQYFLVEVADGIEFSHHKVREVLYDELSTMRKMVSHRKIGQTLLETKEPIPALLAYHFERAGETELAIKQWLLAGRAALGNYALRMAAAHFEKALSLADDAASRIDAHEGLGHALILLDELDQAEPVLQAGIALTAENHDDWGSARLSYRYAQLVNRRYPSGAGEPDIRKALLLAEGMADEHLIARVLLLLSEPQSSKGQISEALATIMQARDICQKIGDKRLEAESLNELGFLYTQLGEFAEGIDAVQGALLIQADYPEPAIATYSWNILGRAYGGCGAYQQAIDAFEKCRQQASVLDDRFFLAQVPNMLGWLYRELYAFERAALFDQESVQLAREFGKGPIEISARLNLCLDWLGMGREEDAFAALVQVDQDVKAGQFGFHQWRWQLRIAHIFTLYYLSSGQAERALASAEELLTLADRADAQKYLCLAQQLRGESLVKLRRFDAAASALEQSIDLADSISYKPVRWEARYQLAELRPGNAQTLLAAAGSLIRETAVELTDNNLQQRFVEAPQIKRILTPTE